MISLNEFEKSVVQNLPLAYRGYIFEDKKLQKFFSQCHWYVPNPDYKPYNAKLEFPEWRQYWDKWAPAVGSSVLALVAAFAALLDLARHGPRRLADHSGDGLDRRVAFQLDLDRDPLVERQVFAHVVLLVLVVDGPPIIAQGLPE